MEQIPMHENQPPLLIAEGLFMYFDEPTVKQIFIALTNHFPEANLLCETLATLMVGQSKHHGSVLKMDQRPEFRWGITNAQDGTAFGSYESGIILTITESDLACSAGSPMYPGCDDR